MSTPREAAARAVLDRVPFGYGMTVVEAQEYANAAIDAFLSALVPADVAGVIERLKARRVPGKWSDTLKADPLDQEAATALQSLSAQVAELTRERDEARQLFDECAVARDTAGFIGSVPECIEELDGETKLLTARAEAAEAKSASYRVECERLREALEASQRITADELNRRTEVEHLLRAPMTARRKGNLEPPPLSAEDMWELANKLSVPGPDAMEAFRNLGDETPGTRAAGMKK